ncbi:proline-rich transmembrane protein 3-like [Ptychodera flava]|uniref:proline-rich transmembrane protein 3-like n=1 Tax=Ptychodera flava TaxID=63121 RepID=UPI00396A7BB2
MAFLLWRFVFLSLFIFVVVYIDGGSVPTSELYARGLPSGRVVRTVVKEASPSILEAAKTENVYDNAGDYASDADGNVRYSKGVVKRDVHSEPEAEPESEPESEPETQPESDGETEPEPRSEGESWPEPGPNWPTAYIEWKSAWQLHVIGFSLAFGLVAIYSLFCFIYHCRDKRTLSKRVLSLSLSFITMLLCLTRCLSLAINPYGAYGSLPDELSRILWSLGFPSLTSAISTLLLVLLDTTKMSLGPPRFQKFSTILPVIIVHFILVLGADMIVTVYTEMRVLLVLCAAIFILWGALLAIGFFTVAFKLYRNLKASRSVAKGKGSDNRSARLVHLICGCATVSMATSLTHLYGAVGVFGVYSDVEFVEAWPWWAFQTLQRMEELIISVLIFALSTKKSDGNGPKSSTVNRIFVVLVPCLPESNRVRPQRTLGDLGATNTAIGRTDFFSGDVSRWTFSKSDRKKIPLNSDIGEVTVAKSNNSMMTSHA